MLVRRSFLASVMATPALSARATAAAAAPREAMPALPQDPDSYARPDEARVRHVSIDLKADFARDRAALAREVDDGAIENVFRVQVTNASEEPRTYAVSVEGAPGIHLAGGDRIHVAAAAIGTETLGVRVPAEALAPGAHPIHFRVTDVTDPRIAVAEDAKFWMPGD